MKISNRLTIKAFYFAVLVALLIFNSCSKDGADGVDGKDGLQGEQGIPGVDGATLLSGTGVPTTALGKNGDFYLDKSSIQIYGPKTSTGWGNPTSLKGADGKDGTNGKDGKDGTNGKDGSKILSGNQIPTEKDGKIGDFYFDTQNIAIYGPKSSSGWGSPLSLKAPSSSDVTILLYKNHSFQKIVEDIERETQNLEYIKSTKLYIENLNNDKKIAENQISIEKKFYDDGVAYINSNVPESEKQSMLDEALRIFNITTAPYRENLTYIEEQLLLQTDLLNKAISSKFYEFESIIPIADNYQNIYDEGLAIVQLRKSSDPSSGWGDYILFDKDSGGLEIYRSALLKDKIIIQGSSHGYTEQEIQALKIDIKVVFIPASNVIEMKAKNIDAKNVEEVVKHLNL